MHTIALALFVVPMLGAAVPVHAQPASFVMAVCGETTRLADVTLLKPVLADGKPLAAGHYEIQLTTQRPAAVPGVTPEAACWVQFMREGALAGRELATVIDAAEAVTAAKGPMPKPNEARVDLLKGGDYYRIWINHNGTNYVIHMPPAP